MGEKLFGNDFYDNSFEVHQELLSTIRVPKNLLYLTDRLPQASYEKLNRGSKLNVSKLSPVRDTIESSDQLDREVPVRKPKQHKKRPKKADDEQSPENLRTIESPTKLKDKPSVHDLHTVKESEYQDSIQKRPK